jgi:hypothetical protein
LTASPPLQQVEPPLRHQGKTIALPLSFMGFIIELINFEF